MHRQNLVMKKSLTKIWSGAPFAFTIAATGAAEGSTVTYSSDDPTVAIVDAATGLVTVLKTGTAVITATASAVDNYMQTSVSCELIVAEEPEPEPEPEERVEDCDGEDCPISVFTDVNPDEWYHHGIHYCVENGLMEGFPNDLFIPGGTTTRAQIVTILWRLQGKPVVNYLLQFEDVASEFWYTEAIRWAASENIVNGYGNGKFGPNDPITREQMVAILYRYCQHKDVGVGDTAELGIFTDAAATSEYAIPAMQWACGSGMIQGIPEGESIKLAPTGSSTRAQVATIFWRFCENILAEN